MSNDEKDDELNLDEDASYQADYDEDTIDYELDADTFLGEDSFEPELGADWDITESDIERPLNLNDADEDDVADGSEVADELYTEAEAEAEAKDDWYDEDDSDSEQDYASPWPLGLIAAAVIALLLLAAGGYGVLQQRTTMEEEIRQLRAALSTTASIEEVATGREALRALELENETLQSQVDSLQAENRVLREAAAKKVAQSVETPASPAPKATQTVAKPKPVSAPTPSPTSGGPGWFVNFGSYTQSATANKWAAKLQTKEGRVAIVPGTKGSTHYYRVRVVDLPSREIAEKIAHQLEKAYSLPSLWIGKQ